MAIITRPVKTGGGTDVVAGNDVLAQEWNSDLNTIYTDYDGNITNANCATGMGLQGSKLADAPDGVTTTKINDLAVTPAKLSPVPLTKFKNLVIESVAFTNNFGVNVNALLAIPYRFTSAPNYIGKVIVWGQNTISSLLTGNTLTVTPLTAIPTATKELVSIYLEGVTIAGAVISGNVIFISAD